MALPRMLAKTVLGLSLAALPLYAQNNQQKTFMLDAALAAKQDEHHLFRAEGLYINKGFNFYGFADMYGKGTDNYYTEFYSRHDFRKGAGAQLEFNDGRDIDAAFRAGGIFDVPRLPKKIYANVKILPLNITKAGAQKEVQLGTFASIDFTKNLHFEHWADYNLWNSAAPLVITEGTLVRKIKGNLSAVFRLSYNVSGTGTGFRAGVRYKVF